MIRSAAFCQAVARSCRQGSSSAHTHVSKIRSLSTAQSHDNKATNLSDDANKSPRIKNPFSVKQFSYQDPLNLASLLTEEEIAIQSAAHDFCQSELQPQILLANRHEDTLGHEQMRRMGEMGMLGSTIPNRYGGGGLSYVSYGLIATEIERVDSSYRSAMSEYIFFAAESGYTDLI